VEGGFEGIPEIGEILTELWSKGVRKHKLDGGYIDNGTFKLERVGEEGGKDGAFPEMYTQRRAWGAFRF